MADMFSSIRRVRQLMKKEASTVTVVGLLATALMMFVATKVEDWTDKDPSRDRMVLIGGVLL